ncbi:DM13 domain-containing protein [Fretibacter rubidus]|uniref:DM13 domain-containing protein n=1 Tax=Fretibacter rubidus TaxID=570162 RepID=UPI00352AF7FC
MKLSHHIKTAIASTAIYTAVAASVIGAHTMAQATTPSTSLFSTNPSVSVTLPATIIKAKPFEARVLTAELATTNHVIQTGQFEGRSDHITTGTAKIIQTADGYELVLGGDFYLDGAPDPVIGFGSNGEYDASTQFTELKKKRGTQTYELPAGFTPGAHSQVFVWCEKFSVPLGVATLN